MVLGYTHVEEETLHQPSTNNDHLTAWSHGARPSSFYSNVSATPTAYELGLDPYEQEKMEKAEAEVQFYAKLKQQRAAGQAHGDESKKLLDPAPPHYPATKPLHTIPFAHTTKSSYPPAVDGEDPYCVSYVTDDPRHPYAWPSRKKWTVLLLICTASLCVTAASSIEASTYTALQRVFGIKKIVAVAGVSLYVFGLGFGSLFLGPMSEFFGRKNIYIGSFACFVLVSLPLAASRNIEGFLVMRFITGFCGSGFLSIAGGTVSDMFPPGKTDIPVAIYTLSPLIGPCVGPLIGGFINQNASWRVTFFVILAWAVVELFILVFFVPETFLPVILKNEAEKRRTETGNEMWYAPMERSGRTVKTVFPAALYSPIQLMLTEKMALAVDLWTALVLGIIYLFFNAIPTTFRTVYGFNLQSTGLAFIAMGLGMCIATATMPIWVRFIQKAAQQNGGRAPPEARLPVGMAGALLCPAGLFWFALASTPKVHYMLPLVGTLLFGMGAYYVFTSVFGFLVSTYSKSAASAMAGNTLLRCIWAGSFPLFADAMYKKLGVQGATSLLCFCTALMIPIPFVLYSAGPKLRADSKYTS